MFNSEFLDYSAHISYSNIPESQSMFVLEKSLQTHGFDLTKRHGIYFVERTTQAPENKTDNSMEQVALFPKNRPVSFFYETIPAIMPDVKASTKLEKGKVSNVDLFLVSVKKSDKQALIDLVNLLDVPMPQVSITAQIVAVSLQNTKSTGVSFLVDQLKLGSLGSVSASAGSSANPNYLKFTVPGLALSAILSNTQGNSNFKTVVTTDTIVFNGESSKTKNGSQVPILTSQKSENANGAVTPKSVTYTEVGNILEVTPEIFGDNIKLKIDIKMSDAEQTSTGVNDSPTIKETTHNSVVSLKSGEILVIGGFRSKRNSTAQSGFLGLSLLSDNTDTGTDFVLLLQATKL